MTSNFAREFGSGQSFIDLIATLIYYATIDRLKLQSTTQTSFANKRCTTFRTMHLQRGREKNDTFYPLSSSGFTAILSLPLCNCCTVDID